MAKSKVQFRDIKAWTKMSGWGRTLLENITWDDFSSFIEHEQDRACRPTTGIGKDVRAPTQQLIVYEVAEEGTVGVIGLAQETSESYAI